MRFIYFIPLFLSACATAAQATAFASSALDRPQSAWQVYAAARAWAASDALPISKFDSDWSAGYSPRDGRNVFLERNRAELGIARDGWQLGLEYRQEASLNADRDTLDFYRLYQLRSRPSGARIFNLDAHFKSWSASGVHVARTFAFDDAAGNGALLKVSGALYAHPRIRDIDLTGDINYKSADTYEFNARYAEANTRYQYPFMKDLSQTGSGASVSMALQWPLSDHLTANVTANDLWSRMRWSNLPAVQKTIASDVGSKDPDGYVNYQPLLSGQNSQIERTDPIGASEAVSLTYQRDQWAMKLGADRIDGVVIPAASTSYASKWGEFTASYETRFGTLGLGYAYRGFHLQIRSNRWSLSDASAVGLDAGAKITF
jgi:hypothetical protein